MDDMDEDTRKRLAHYRAIEPDLGARVSVRGVLDELGRVLEAQDEAWGAAHDSEHGPHDWLELIDKHLRHADGDEFNGRWFDYQRELRTIAALCLQALRTYRRANLSVPAGRERAEQAQPR